jgi:hypothetical protein
MTMACHLAKHYASVWGQEGKAVSFSNGPTRDLPCDFQVLEYSPKSNRRMWTYATAGMSKIIAPNPIELHMFSKEKSEAVVELLYATAHFHATGAHLGLWHTVNFGRPWQNRSMCNFGLISLPYLDGPSLENLEIRDHLLVKCFWLIPITESELQLKKQMGIEALESLFEKRQFDFADPRRKSVC